MHKLLKRNPDYAILVGTNALAVATTAIHPLIPLFMAGGLLATIFIAANQQLLLVLLVTVSLVKGALEANFYFFQTVDYSLIISGLALLILGWKLLNPEIRQHLGEYRLAITGYLVWVVWMGVASTYAPRMDWALLHSLRFAFFTSILFIGPLIVINSIKDSRQVLIIFFVVGGLGALYLNGNLAYILASGAPLVNLTRLTVLKANPIASARVFAICAAMAASFVLTQRKINWRWLFLMVFFIISAIFTGSRGPVLSFLAAVSVMAVISGRISLKRLSLLVAALLFIGIALMLLAPAGLTTRFGLTFAGEIALTSQGLTQFSTVTNRFQMWQMALELWTSDLRHFLVGEGPAGYGILFPWRNVKYPHNLPLEILAEFGLIGMAVFLVHITTIGKETILRLKSGLSTEEQLWLAATLTMAASTMFSGDLNDNRMLWFLMSCLLASINVRRREQMAQHQSKTGKRAAE